MTAENAAREQEERESKRIAAKGRSLFVRFVVHSFDS